MKNITVAIIDDEKFKRTPIANAISGKSTRDHTFHIPNWAVGTSGADGLRILDDDTNQEIDIFLVDGRMQGNKDAGYTLSLIIKHLRPEAVIISISSESDERRWYDAHLHEGISSKDYAEFLAEALSNKQRLSFEHEY